MLSGGTRLPVVTMRFAPSRLGGRGAGILLRLSSDSDGEEGESDSSKSNDLHVVGIECFLGKGGVRDKQ